MPRRKIHVAVAGGGIGGLTCAISCARGGAEVTVLEAARELGEIGAGIQMFGNVSRFLVRTGIDEIIGDNLVEMGELRTWDYKGELLGRIETSRVKKMQGFPWWVVRRDHLHGGLVEGCRREGVEVVTGFRVAHIDDNEDGVTVVSEKGERRRFDCVVAADGVRSFFRRTMFPDVQLKEASRVGAYRAIVSYEEVFAKIPEARSKIGNTMDAWIGPNGYVLLYPLTGGKELNVVTLARMDHAVLELEDCSLEEFQQHYEGWDPFILKVIRLVQETKRWPILVVPPMNSWSNKWKNIVLSGDAAHGMQNHMAQGAATAMEDGIFFGRVISEVVRGTINLAEAVHLYELKRIPRAWHKQQSAFFKGEAGMATGADKAARDRAQVAEVRAWDMSPVHPLALPPTYRTWQLMSSPDTVPSILYYDAEGDADFAVCEYLQNQGDMNSKTLVSRGLMKKWWNSMYDNGLDPGHPLNSKL